MNELNVSTAHKELFKKRLKGLTSAIKKTLSHPKANPTERKRFNERIAELEEKEHPIVYIDESGFRKDWLRTHGWALKGKRCYGEYDWHLKNQTNAIGALYDGKLFAVGLFECSINGNIFESWMKQILLPDLPKNSVIVMDNAAFHKRETTKELIEAAGHKILWLPPYSPDLNPIEKKWASVKHTWRAMKIDCIDKLFRICMQC